MFNINLGFGGSKSKSKTSQDNSLDPWSQAQYGDLSGQVKGLLGGGFKTYDGQLSAGANPYQTQAAQGVQGLLGYKPQTVAAKSLADVDVSKYLNPNLDSVVSRTLDGIEQTRQRQQVADSQGATMAGAWGGSRHGVADSLTNDAALRASGDAEASLRAAAYDKAVAAAQSDIDRDFASQTTNANLGLSGAQLGLQGAGLLGQMGGQMWDQEQAGLDRRYAEFNRQQDDPFRRAQGLLGLLGATPMITDSQGTNKGWQFGGQLSGGFTYGGGK